MTKASIITIGSELLSGQILNRNGAWLSNALEAYGIETQFHLTCDDDTSEIVRCINYASKDSNLILVTGGLGPTTDDLTRNALSAWSGQKLEFSDIAWAKIKKLFAKSGRATPPSNQQQAYFPQGSQILSNEKGTADGFIVSKGQKIAVALPGPPRELAWLWQNYVAAYVSKIAPKSRRLTYKWRTIGLGESHLAEMIEASLLGAPVQVAYRAHAPFVELKLSFDPAQQQVVDVLAAKITGLTKDWLLERNDDDVFHSFHKQISKMESVGIFDCGSSGHFLEALASTLRSHEQKGLVLTTTYDTFEGCEAFVEEYIGLQVGYELTLVLAQSFEEGIYCLGAKREELISTKTFQLPYSAENLRHRNHKAVAYLAAKGFSELMTNQQN